MICHIQTQLLDTLFNRTSYFLIFLKNGAKTEKLILNFNVLIHNAYPK